jgi:hypothetical protein
MIGRFVIVVGALALLAACAPSAMLLVGTARPPISAADVKVYDQPPPSFEEVAILNAWSHSLFRPGGPQATDKVIARLKREAAKLGANGIILGDFSDAQTSSLGTGLGSDTYTHNSSISLGAGGAIGIYKKTGKGRAIYVPPG